MVLPNCSRTLAYSTAISRQAQLTPTASADARIRNTVRARRAAPRKHPVLGHRHATQCHRPDGAGGVEGVQRVDRDAFGGRVDDDHVVTRDEHQHICVGRTENRWAFTGDDQIRTDGHTAGQAERTDLRAVGKSRK